MRIVVEPCFNEAHFMKAHIANMCELLEPDLFVIAEGMFPNGPEAHKAPAQDFADKWTTDGVRSKDIEELYDIVSDANEMYDTQIHIVKMEYDPKDINRQTYIKSYRAFEGIIDPSPGDMIFPVECDMFLSPTQAKTLLETCSTIGPDAGIYSTYTRFFEAPYVLFNDDRPRSIAFRYGSGELYNWHLNVYCDERYFDRLLGIDLGVFHYEWLRPDWYWDMRIDQLPRTDNTWTVIPEVRKAIEQGRDDLQQRIDEATSDFHLKFVVNRLGPEDHPIHILDHPNFVKYYG